MCKRLIILIGAAVMWCVSLNAQNNQLSNDRKDRLDETTQEHYQALELLPPPAVRIDDIPAYRNLRAGDGSAKRVSNISTETEVLMAEETELRADVALEKLETKNETVELKAKSTLSDISFALDITDAHRVAFDRLLVTSAESVYFIQLAALSRSKGNFGQFKKLTALGNIYKIYIGGKTKVKLGYFNDRWEAERILNTVRSKGFSDAFITRDPLNTSSMELVLSEFDNDGYRASGDNTSFGEKANDIPRLSYKVRLASYEDPIWFDIDKARKLGRIEQWTKGKWTIFILTGFNSYEDAVQGLYKAESHGFNDAEVVIDNNGILERIKK